MKFYNGVGVRVFFSIGTCESALCIRIESGIELGVKIRIQFEIRMESGIESFQLQQILIIKISDYK